MGQRGPLTRATSVRGQRAATKPKRLEGTLTSACTPAMPSWLPEDTHETWDAVISDLEAATVPLQRIDGHCIALFVITVIETKKAANKGDAKLAARLGRDALQWANCIGATPASRARLNIAVRQPVADDPWEQFDKGKGN